MWGESRRREGELGQTLVVWTKGQPATLAPFGSKLLRAERRAQARLAPQLDAMRAGLERAFAVAFDESRAVVVALENLAALSRFYAASFARPSHLQASAQIASAQTITAPEGRSNSAESARPSA